MNMFLTQDNILLALGAVAAFGLGWLAHRWITTTRENGLVRELRDQLAFLERQRDSAHRVSLELADTHNKLVGEHLEAEWTIHSLKSDLKVRDARIEKLLMRANAERPVVNADAWSLEKTRNG